MYSIFLALLATIQHYQENFCRMIFLEFLRDLSIIDIFQRIKLKQNCTEQSDINNFSYLNFQIQGWFWQPAGIFEDKEEKKYPRLDSNQ